MLHLSRSAAILAVLLAIAAALLGFVTPAEAVLSVNGTSINALSVNGMNARGISATAAAQNPANARITAGSALGDLNGVAVETVIIQDAATR